MLTILYKLSQVLKDTAFKTGL